MTDSMIKVDLTAFTRSAKLIMGKDWPKAVVNAFAEMAEEGMLNVRELTRQRFKLHTEYITRGVKHYPMNSAQKNRAANALKRFGDMNAAVYLRGSNTPKKSLEFMADHEFAETREAQKKYIAFPTKTLKEKSYRTGRGKVRMRWKPALLLEHYKERGGGFNGLTTTNEGRKLGPRKKRLPGHAFIIGTRAGPMIARRISRPVNKGDKHLEFLYMLKPKADIKKRWGFVNGVYGTVFKTYDTIIIKHVSKMKDYSK